MRVLGIDPGFVTTGYGVVERVSGTLRAVTFGAVRTPAGIPQADRLAYLRRALCDVIEATRPDVVAVERLFFNANVRTAMSVGQASGVALVTAAEAGLAVADYTPPEVKRSVVGVGNAAKQQVQAMVAALLKLPTIPQPADAADACALAICHLHRTGLSRAIASAERKAAG
ncbi:MAG TPA: crossover junction endodeoxyribonuclease RuvC [Actinomycetota bacterium]|nr:crossover junction endodeoxyribonuclease RuvC [Actinomycetota bacterium]